MCRAKACSSVMTGISLFCESAGLRGFSASHVLYINSVVLDAVPFESNQTCPALWFVWVKYWEKRWQDTFRVSFPE